MKHLWRKEQKEKEMSLFLETLKVYRDGNQLYCVESPSSSSFLYRAF